MYLIGVGKKFDFYQQLIWWILLLENRFVTVHICSGYSNNVKLGFKCCSYVFKLSYNNFYKNYGNW